MSLTIDNIKREFPALQQNVHGAPLVYLDNAATTQKPQVVIDAIEQYYVNDNANVHRGVHALSARATQQYELVRSKVAHFIGAKRTEECIFVRGTTEAINMVAQCFVLPRLQPGDEILLTQLEHHSNIVPWVWACKKSGATLKVAPLNEDGSIDFDAFCNALTSKTKWVSMAHISNALGTINPIEEMIAAAHQVGAYVMIDGAQAVSHESVNVQALDADFYAFSAHKMYGPTGIGILWGKSELLESMEPYQGGGEMIQYVSFEEVQYAPLPSRLEAGTPNIAGAIGLGAAITFLEELGLSNIKAYEQSLLDYALTQLSTAPVRLIGTPERRAPVISFLHQDAHAHDVGTILDTHGIAIRSGHHCAMPVMAFYDVPATTRASIAFYNTKEDIDKLVMGLYAVKEVFA